MIYEPLLGNYSDLVLNEFISQIDILVISLFYLIFGFFALIVYRKEPKFKSFLYLGLISLFSGCGGIYLAEFKKHIYDAPLLYSQIFMPCLLFIYSNPSCFYNTSLSNEPKHILLLRNFFCNSFDIRYFKYFSPFNLLRLHGK